MGADLVVATPSRQELEAMTLADRVRLETVATGVAEIAREMNDKQIRKLHADGMSLRGMAAEMGVHHMTAKRRLARIGLRTPAQIAAGVAPATPPPQNGDSPDAADGEAEEVVTGEVVHEATNPDDRPVHYLPDVVDPDAETNLRTQALHWFSQGHHVENLLNDDATVEPRDRPDRAAIKREVAEMVRIARRLKGAI